MMSSTEYHIVSYQGMQFNIKKCYRYIATDSDGTIFAYTHKPYIENDNWVGYVSYFQLDSLTPNIDWKESLVEIKL
jgi:hypothetical protein